MDSKEQKPFLPAAEKDYERDEQSSIDGHSTKVNPRRRVIGLVLIHAGLLVLYCFATYVITSKNSCPLEELALPGLKVKHQFKLYDKFNKSPFAGPPGPDVEEAWHNLMLNMSVHVTKEELDAHGQTSIELPGGGYLAWLGVFHELHCVKLLRRWSYKEHYYPNMTEHEYDHQIVHIDHCIDWLRNAAMCHADTSALAVFKWDKNPKPMLNTKRVPHKCVDWDELLGSHQDRIVTHEEVISLVKPNLISTSDSTAV